METSPNSREVIEEVVINWLKEEKKDNYVQGTLKTSYTLDGIFDVGSLVESLHQELQKAREQRKGWKGYLVVDPETDNYTYSDVYLNRIDAEKWLKANGISGLRIIEVDVYQSELDQPDALTK